ncbi:hypothetical protein [Sphingomonas pruni]|uniref:hypothetical protein n=1 Tax=Sphingomonas pruni TaxID=40683 RepID=UPI0008352BA5|nr:hypothetical protein [Sphingomonas pruni]
MSKRIAILLTLGLVGCTEAPGVYPSLALRPIESRSDAEPEVVTPVATPDSELDKKIAAIDAKLGASEAAFAASASTAESAARSPAAQAVGSNEWVRAESALADLDSLRVATLGAITDLDQLASERGVVGDPPYPALEDARTKAQAQLDAQEKKIAAIKAILGEK